jgi:hypothetical protein
MSLRKQIVISGVAAGETAGLDLTLATLHNAANKLHWAALGSWQQLQRLALQEISGVNDK